MQHMTLPYILHVKIQKNPNKNNNSQFSPYFTSTKKPLNSIPIHILQQTFCTLNKCTKCSFSSIKNFSTIGKFSPKQNIRDIQTKSFL